MSPNPISKHRPWIAPPPVLDASGKEVVEDKPEKSWALLGKYISQYVVFTGASSAWLLRYMDHLLSSKYFLFCVHENNKL